MTKCRHTLVDFSEELIDAITHVVENGEKVDEVFDTGTGQTTGFMNIYCRRCKRHWRFNRFVSIAGLRRVPNWIKEMAEMLNIPFIVVRK